MTNVNIDGMNIKLTKEYRDKAMNSYLKELQDRKNLFNSIYADICAVIVDKQMSFDTNDLLYNRKLLLELFDNKFTYEQLSCFVNSFDESNTDLVEELITNDGESDLIIKTKLGVEVSYIFGQGTYVYVSFMEKTDV